MIATEQRVVLDDGKETILQSWGTHGPVVLCVHGITSSRRSWTRLAEYLAPANRIYAYDQRGHGDSADVAGPMTLAQSVRDLQAVRARLPGPVHMLIGHSWGGAVALLGGIAIHPARVVAIDPMIRVPARTFEPEYVDDLREFFALAPGEREPAIRAMYHGLAAVDVDAKRHAMTHMSVASLEALGTENDVDAGAWDLRERIARYPTPLLVCVAGIESVLSAEDQQFVTERGGPNVTMRVFPNDGHNLHRTAFDEFAHAVETFG